MWNFFDEYVVRFDISMDNALFVEVTKGFKNLYKRSNWKINQFACVELKIP